MTVFANGVLYQAQRPLTSQLPSMGLHAWLLTVQATDRLRIASSAPVKTTILHPLMIIEHQCSSAVKRFRRGVLQSTTSVLLSSPRLSARALLFLVLSLVNRSPKSASGSSEAQTFLIETDDMRKRESLTLWVRNKQVILMKPLRLV